MTDLDLATYAEVCADLAEGDSPPGEVLAARGLSDEAWTRASLAWAARLAEDARQGGASSSLALQLSDAFVRAQDSKRPLRKMDVEEWAALVSDVELLGVGRALGAHKLSVADHSRLVRYWARALAADPQLAARFERVRDAT